MAVQDFCVEIVSVAAGETYELGDLESPSVILTLSSVTLEQKDVCSMDASFGSSAFLSAKTRATIVAGPDGVRLTRSFTNISQVRGHGVLDEMTPTFSLR
jgi:mannose-6-phosphate isomerase class I